MLRKRISTKIRNAKHTKFMNRNIEYMRRITVNIYKDNLKSEERYQNPKILSKYDKKLYSQHEEDGIILPLLSSLARRFQWPGRCGYGRRTGTGFHPCRR